MQRTKSIFAQWRIFNLIARGCESTPLPSPPRAVLLPFRFSLSTFHFHFLSTNRAEFRFACWIELNNILIDLFPRSASHGKRSLLGMRFAQFTFRWLKAWDSGCGCGLKPQLPAKVEQSNQPTTSVVTTWKGFYSQSYPFLIWWHAHKGQSWFAVVIVEI